MSDGKLYDEKLAELATSQWLSDTVKTATSDRFILMSGGFGILNPWVKRARYSLMPNRSIDIRWYDIKSPDGRNPLRDYLVHMLNSNNSDSFVLTNYDDLGREFGTISFYGCKLVDHFAEFDYFVSDTLSHKLVFNFADFKFD
jgi:hypothetical protein